MVSLGLGRPGEGLGKLGARLGRWGPRLGQRLQNIEGMKGRKDQEGEWVRPFVNDEEASLLSESRPRGGQERGRQGGAGASRQCTAEGAEYGTQVWKVGREVVHRASGWGKAGGGGASWAGRSKPGRVGRLTCRILQRSDRQSMSSQGWYMPSVTQFSRITSMLTHSNHVHTESRTKQLGRR